MRGRARGRRAHGQSGRVGAHFADGTPKLPLRPGLEAEKSHHGPGLKDGVHPRIVRETSAPCPGP